MFDGTSVPVRSHSIQIAPGVMELVGIVPGHYIAKFQILSSGYQPQVMQEREIDVSQSGEIENARVAAFTPLSAAVRFEPPAAMLKQASVQLRDKKSSRAFSEKIGANGEVEFKTGSSSGQL